MAHGEAQSQSEEAQHHPQVAERPVFRAPEPKKSLLGKAAWSAGEGLLRPFAAVVERSVDQLKP